MAICYVLVHHYPSPLAGTALVKLPKQVIIQMKENYTRDVYGYIKLYASYIDVLYLAPPPWQGTPHWAVNFSFYTAALSFL